MPILSFPQDLSTSSAAPARSQGQTRRRFLKQTLWASAALGMGPRIWGAQAAAASPSETVRLGIIGLGGIDVPGSVGGRGRQLIAQIRKLQGVRIVALCDLDSSVLDNGVQAFKGRGEEVGAHRDLRELLERKDIDAVVVATPNHWHSLATIWACQAGKDVYVEKPFSHNIWEGRQTVAAAHKLGRMVQVGTQARSSTVLRQAFDEIHRGQYGPIRFAHALVYRPREGLEKVSAPLAPPATVNYDLWCGPAQELPLMRKHLHYEWHWFWNTGNGELGNNGVHVIDMCRWGLQQKDSPTRALSIGGRYSVEDSAETPNTQIAFLDFKPAPLICEVRNVRRAGSSGIGNFRNIDSGIIIDCEGGSLVGDGSRAAFFDKAGTKIKDVQDKESAGDLEAAHLTSFLKAIRSRRREDLAADALEGHLSAVCCHLGNISHRVGSPQKPEAIQEAIRSNGELADAFERCREYLRENGVELSAQPAVLGPMLRFDSRREQFVGEGADRANQLTHREYRAPYAVPKMV